MDHNTRILLMSAAGGAEKVYVEDVFSTWLYTGTGSTQAITNGIDLAGKGGLVWRKNRNLTTGAISHYLHDTVRSPQSGMPTSHRLSTDLLNGEFSDNDYITSWNSDGFSFGTGNPSLSGSGNTVASWTFRKEPKFFDVVTYTGDGNNRTIAHNLESVPGCIIVKRTDAASNVGWAVYHRSLSNTEVIYLNSTGQVQQFMTATWNSTTPTSSVFSLGSDADVNANGGTYVAYLFAHDAGGFGDSGNDNVVSCGSFTTDGSGNATITLGWEPQWLLIKRTDGINSWWLCDPMRGLSQTSFAYLSAESNNQEFTYSAGAIKLNPTGCSFSGFWPASAKHIYIAIRRGPMKKPLDATRVFTPVAYTGNSTSNSTVQNLTTNIAADMAWITDRNYGAQNKQSFDKLRGKDVVLYQSSTSEESNFNTLYSPASVSFNNTQTVLTGQFTANGVYNSSGFTFIAWNFCRAPGFFDIVCYTGTGVNRTVDHGLGVTPELMLIKKRNVVDRWVVYANNDNTDYLVLNTTAGSVDDNTMWNDTSPTELVFTLGTNNDVNGSTDTFVAYLFASCPGVSKVGSYTGTGATLDIDCGFSNGARFVMIKRTEPASTGDWYIWDTARGIISGNDPYLLLNSTATEVTSTDYIDPLSSGFQISSTAPAAINALGGNFIYLAIA